ncbi:hypothetical protein SCH4B_1588 [Ruegeria sp. TrichCH4B]|nr:hypothetical protein SCH4B_1588 [Ruegeria sp. TrichCH4B]
MGKAATVLNASSTHLWGRLSLPEHAHLARAGRLPPVVRALWPRLRHT